VTTDEVMKLLAVKYGAPAWAFLPQVRNATGWAREPRTADALAMGLWPSRGMELNGFEVKVTRGDWLRELRDPAKADEIFQFCDRWWVVAADKKIVLPGELPPTWGLLVPRNGGLGAETEAPRLTPSPLDKPFLAAILRKTVEVCVPKDEVDSKIEAARQNERERLGHEVERAQRELADYRKEVGRFESESGVKIVDAWSWGNIGRAVKDVITRGPEKIRQAIEEHQRWAQRIVEDCEQQLTEHDPAPSTVRQAE